MNQRTLLALVVIVLLLAAVGAILASSGALDLSWWSVDGGGGKSLGGPYTLSGALGQYDAGVMRGDQYEIHGGLRPAPPRHWAYLPIMQK